MNLLISLVLLTIVTNIGNSFSINDKENEDITNIEFCLYTNNNVIKMTNPYYVDSNNNTVYFNTIEDYAKFIGPDWFGVSYCGNNTLVNNIGKYYTVIKNKSYNKRESKENKSVDVNNKKEKEVEDNENNDKHKYKDDKEEVKDENTDDVYRSRKIEELKQQYKEIYDDLMKNGIKNIALNSNNPAYNPYHPSLIRVEQLNDDPLNTIYTIGMPYRSEEHIKLIDNSKSDMEECGNFSNMKGSTYTCSVSFTTEIQDTISISNSNGNSYHKSYGKVYSKGDANTDEINKTIELAKTLSNSKSMSLSESKGVSNSIENIYTVINSNSKSTTDNKDQTITNSRENSKTYTVNEEQSHAHTDSGEVVEESNWSKSEEISHTEENTRMEKKDFDKVKNEVYTPRLKDIPIDQSLFENVTITSFDNYVYPAGEKLYNIVTNKEKFDFIGCKSPLELFGIDMPETFINDACNGIIGWGVDTIKDIFSKKRNLQYINSMNEKSSSSTTNLKKRGGKGGNPYLQILSSGGEIIGQYGNLVAMGDQSRIQRAGIRSSENIAIDQANLQYQLALAGTHSSSDTVTHGSTRGGSISSSKGWSDTATTTSGFSNSWANTVGYSDARTTGHSETSTKENSVSDATSKMLSSTFNKDTGWVNEESKSDTSSHGYTFGNSVQVNTNNQTSYESVIEKSAQHSYEISRSNSTSTTSTKTVTINNIEDNSCHSIVALPMFKTEVVIWAKGHITELNETRITFNRSLIPVEFVDFVTSVIDCKDKYNYKETLTNNDFDKFNFIENDKNVNSDTLISGDVLLDGEAITTKSKKYSFGLLGNGELVLCKGDTISEENCQGNKKIWSNGINTIPDDHNDLKFFIGYNGHLYITAKNIYKKNISNVKYSKEYIELFEKIIDLDNNLNGEKERIKKLILDYYKVYNNNVVLTNSIKSNTISVKEKRARIPHLPKTQPIITKGTTATTSNHKSTTTNVTTNNNKSKTITVTTSSHKSTTTTINSNKSTTTIIPTNINKSSTSIIITNNNNSTTTNNATVTATTTTTITTTVTSTTSPTSDNPNGITIEDDDYIIWDSLPKDLPFNVGFPDDKGYYLHIKDEDDVRIGASVTLYDGVGVKIWEIKGHQENYNGYAFPVEYVYPLSINGNIKADYEYYDKHNVHNSKVVKDLNTNTIEMNCSNRLNQNEALISENKKYRFYVQKTGNMVIKDNSRTTWSSNTANIDLFDGPYKIVFSPLGEIILRDKSNYSIWHSINPLALVDSENLLNSYKFYLTLTNEGELIVEDQYHNVYWSNWNKRLYDGHIRFVNPVLYEITSCSEHVRNKYIYEIFSETDIYNYNYFENSDEDPIFIKKYYFNNLLPGESLLSDYNMYLNVTDTEVKLINGNLNETTIIQSCPKDEGVKELQLNNQGLFLICNNKTKKTIVSIDPKFDEKGNNLNKYNRLSIEYRPNMKKPELMIFNVKNWEPIWKYSGIRYLSSIRQVNRPLYGSSHGINNVITVDNSMVAFDKIYSSEKGNNEDFIYLSSITGLEFKNAAVGGVKNITLANNNLYINDNVIVNNNLNMELTYEASSDKLIAYNNTHHIWELYSSLHLCDYFISNSTNCNTIYTMNKMLIYYISPNEKTENTLISLIDNLLFYSDYNEKIIYNFNIAEYTNINDSIFSLSVLNNGNIELNNGQYLLHKEYFVSDEYYYLYVKYKNLILRSSTGEYKWAAKKTITNRPYDASEIKIGESFREGEMLYCGDYSMIILNGKLLYRDHKSKISTEIKYSKNNSGYLYKIVVGSNNISFKDKTNEDIYNIYDNKISNNSKLYCDKNTRSIVWKINNTIKWRYPEINSNNGDLQDKKYILLCSKYYNKCLYAANRIGNNVRYADYSKTLKNFKWYFEIINKKSYLKSAINDDICLIVDNDKIITGKCSENIDKARISYNEPKNYIEYFNSSNKQYKCISGIDDRNNRNSPQYLTLANCNKKDEKMIWEIKTPN